MKTDLLIVGGGPAGLAAAIYGARAKLKTVVLEKGAVGGMAFTTREIANYPGFFEAPTGPDLMNAMATHAKKLGAEIVREQVVDIAVDSETKVVTTKKGNRYESRALILALGSEPRLLHVPGESRLRGSGVSYCATCDADSYEGRTVVVVGNGDAAVEEALYITKYAAKVIMVVIHDEGVVDCNRLSAEKAFQCEKMEFFWNSVLTEIEGTEGVETVMVKNLKTGTHSRVATDGVFIYVGATPATHFLEGKVDLGDQGHIITNEMMETSVEGVYAAGDARVKYLRQVVTAASDGATAAFTAERYLIEQNDFNRSVLCRDSSVVLAFWNPYDEESIGMISRLEHLVCDAGGPVVLLKIDVSRKKALARKYGVVKIPTALLLKKGEVVQVLPEDPSGSRLIL